MELIQNKNSRVGVIGTILVHSLLLLLFLKFGMSYQDPPQPNFEGAMLINFGNSGGGSSAKEETVNEEESAANNTNNETTAEDNSSQENVATQTNTETVNLNASQNTNTTETQETVSENLSDALNALDNANDNSDNNSSNNTSDNGDSNGNTSGNNSGPSNGIGYDLGGRGKVSFKKPNNPTQEDGKVVVAIVVDKYGKVIKATPGARGSTTTNPILFKKAKEAALQAKFTSKLDAPSDQKGTMTFVFILN